MANHCIDCDVCGDDLRGSGQHRCNWADCPGYLGDLKDLEKICYEHPNKKIKKEAQEIYNKRINNL